MRTVLILMSTLGFWCSCTVGGKIPDRSGVYSKRISGIGNLKLSLSRLSDTVYYFEHELNKDNLSDSLIGDIDGLGILKLRNDTLVYINSGRLYHFKAFFPKISELVVDSLDFNMPNELSLLSGTFNRFDSGALPIPDFSKKFQLSVRWEEGVSVSDGSVKLFSYPYSGSRVSKMHLSKGTIVNSFMNIPSDYDNKGAFYFVTWMNNEKLISGWMESMFFFDNVKRVYKCERYEDGTVFKWNKEEGYSLFFDSTGKLLRRENDNND